MADNAGRRRVAVRVEDGFEDVELIGPAQRLRDAGVDVTLRVTARRAQNQP